jgi:hypothetical protein
MAPIKLDEEKGPRLVQMTTGLRIDEFQMEDLRDGLSQQCCHHKMPQPQGASAWRLPLLQFWRLKSEVKTSRLRSKGHLPGLQMVSSWGRETEFCVSPLLTRTLILTPGHHGCDII